MLDVDKIDVYHGDVPALRSVSVRVSEGELVAVVGSNGAGKTTLLQTISGVHTPRAGSIRLDGRRIDHLEPHRVAAQGIVQVPEGRRIFVNLTVEENLEVGCYLKKAEAKKEENLKLVYELFPVLKGRRTQKAGTLSGGEQQMLAVARALMSSPKILMLDEISLGLAPLLTRRVFDTVEALNKTGLTVLLVDQNVPLALKAADRGYVLENGRIVAEGPDLVDDPLVKKAYLGV